MRVHTLQPGYPEALSPSLGSTCAPSSCAFLFLNQAQEVRGVLGSLRHAGARGITLSHRTDAIQQGWVFSAGSQVPAMTPPFLVYVSFPHPHFRTPSIACLASAVGSEISDLCHEQARPLLARTPDLKCPSQTHLQSHIPACRSQDHLGRVRQGSELWEACRETSGSQMGTASSVRTKPLQRGSLGCTW